ncbi:FadR/GntR family transcriptional regulator [Amycolatopsis sp. YIM 10]|uniref:FadR/GntR family transcriptional regulator n=1 Tax=Amycolatopsis sp. YIM 10 TaxID=2653857 RepID=UPI0018848149|nr:FCD domain-containing protein [Amycolatopsis sp. YIM 10]
MRRQHGDDEGMADAVPEAIHTDGDHFPLKEKRGEILARKIEEQIMRAGWPVGEVLGSEADLLQEYKVSRAVLREAVRIMEHHGTARTRRGPGGGLVVTKPDARAVVRSAAVYLDSEGITPDKLAAARTGVELIAVQLAAQNIDEDGITRLRAALDRERASVAGGESVTSGRNDVHTVIAALSGNPAIQLFTETLTLLEVEVFRSVSEPKTASDARAQFLDDHIGIVEAVVSGDASVARFRMQQHLARVAAEIHPH